METTLSDIETAPDGTFCDCGQPATDAAEWEDPDYGGRWWVYYCESCWTAETRPDAFATLSHRVTCDGGQAWVHFTGHRSGRISLAR